jgi:AraC-like DNA-binding protein
LRVAALGRTVLRMSLLHDYRELPAAPVLRAYVECYWEAQSSGAPGFNPVEPLIPDLRVELIFNAGEAYSWAGAASEEPVAAPSFACIGMRGRSLSIRQPGRLKHFAIRFRPGGLPAFARLRLGLLTQRCVDAHELWSGAARELADRLGDASSTRERVRAADAFLSSRLSTQAEHSALARSAASVLAARGGRIDIAAVAASHGVSYKQLERVFERDVGLSPKHFARVARLQRALTSAVRDQELRLASVAAEAGYADQAHLTRDFRALIGRSPRAFFRERFAVFETLKASGSLALKQVENVQDGRRGRA